MAECTTSGIVGKVYPIHRFTRERIPERNLQGWKLRRMRNWWIEVLSLERRMSVLVCMEYRVLRR